MKLQNVHICITVILISALSGSCVKRDLAKKGIITFTVGTVTITDTAGKTRSAQVADIVAPGTMISTGSTSEATLQVENLGVLRILQNSKITLQTLLDEKTGSLIDVKKGALYSKITKMKKGARFQVKTPTSLASVRGTEFLTRYSPDKQQATVALKSGSVEVTPLTTGEKAAPEKVIKPGEVITLKEKKSDIRDQTKGESLELKKLSLQPFIEKVDRKSVTDIKKEIDSVKKEEKELDEEINKSLDMSKLAPLDRLRAMGRALTKLHLRDGSKLIGSVESQNARMLRLNTGVKILGIPKSDIIRRESVR